MRSVRMEAGSFHEEVERVYREQHDRLWRAVLLFSGDVEITSDAVAEAFAQALRRGEAIQSLERWLWRAAFRIAAGELKERVRPGPIEAETSYEQHSSMDIVRGLQVLTETQRAAIVLFYYADRPAQEVARILGSTAPAVRVHLYRARTKLRALLEEKDD
jgi:RNA polymerase sigma factor (sigma-70 family)